MSKHSLDPNYGRLMTKAVDTLKQGWADNGETLRHKDGKLFSASVVLTYIFGIFYVVMLLATLFGLLLKTADAGPSSSAYETLVFDTRLTAICLVLSTAAIIFLRFHKYIVSGVLSLCEAVMFLPNQALDNLFTEGAWKRVVLFTLPTVVLALAAAYMLFTVISDRLAVKRLYNDFIRRIQASHPNNEGSITTEAEWNSYVDEFLSEPVHLKPKKSLRKRAKKASSEDKG